MSPAHKTESPVVRFFHIIFRIKSTINNCAFKRPENGRAFSLGNREAPLSAPIFAEKNLFFPTLCLHLQKYRSFLTKQPIGNPKPGFVRLFSLKAAFSYQYCFPYLFPRCVRVVRFTILFALPFSAMLSPRCTLRRDL